MPGQIYDGPRDQRWLMLPSDVTVIGVDTDDREGHVLYDRRVHDPLDENMVAGFMDSTGQLQDIVTRKNGLHPGTKRGNFEVIFGRTRTLHIREAARRMHAKGLGELRIGVVIKRGVSDLDCLKMIAKENQHRRPDDPLNIAVKANRMRTLGVKLKELAQIFKVDPHTMALYLKLLDLDDGVQAAVKAGTIGLRAAAALVSLQRKDQLRVMGELIAAGDVSRDTAARVVAAAVGELPAGDITDAATPDLADAAPASVRPSSPKAAAKARDARIREALYRAPTRGVLRKLLDAHREKTIDVKLPEAVVEWLEWAAGARDPRKIKGLTAALREIDPPKTPKPETAESEAAE